MRSLANLSQVVFREPWLVDSEVYEALQLQVLQALGLGDHPGAGVAVTEEALEGAGDPLCDARLPDTGERVPIGYFHTMERAPGVARVPLYGMTTKGLRRWEYYYCSSACLDYFMQGVTQAAEHPDIHSIVLDFRSPGGIVAGVPEAARLIREVAAGKDVFAFTDTKACSSAFWLYSAAGTRFCTPSSFLGGIGAVIRTVDRTKAKELMGIKETIFQSGKHKGAESGLRPLNAEERRIFQERVEMIGDEFREAVREYLPGVDEGAMEGLGYFGEEAAALGLTDQVVDSFDAMLAELGLLESSPFAQGFSL
mgnify:CR=1 FL=1